MLTSCNKLAHFVPDPSSDWHAVICTIVDGTRLQSPRVGFELALLEPCLLSLCARLQVAVVVRRWNKRFMRSRSTDARCCELVQLWSAEMQKQHGWSNLPGVGTAQTSTTTLTKGKRGCRLRVRPSSLDAHPYWSLTHEQASATDAQARVSSHSSFGRCVVLAAPNVKNHSNKKATARTTKSEVRGHRRRE